MRKDVQCLIYGRKEIMDSSNIYRFNGIDPFDNWVVNEDGVLRGYYPRNSLINLISKQHGVEPNNGTITIPYGVISIAGSCFKKNKAIKQIIIPKTVNKISDVAFLETDIVLYVYKNSYAEKYAKRKGLKYRHYDEGDYYS